MAQFVRIGQNTINLDLVTEIIEMPDYVNVRFGEEYTTFRKDDAVVLKEFIARQPFLAKTMGHPCYLCSEVSKCFLCGNEVCEDHASMRKYNDTERLICDTCDFA